VSGLVWLSVLFVTVSKVSDSHRCSDAATFYNSLFATQSSSESLLALLLIRYVLLMQYVERLKAGLDMYHLPNPITVSV
jgi:hypothetical protein